MTGHLHLVCSRNTEGASYLSAQSFRAPLHLSKPHSDADTLVVNMVNPTAGIFDDDNIAVDVRVESDARMVLTTPSASRVYRSRSGGASQISQRLEVQSGGFLECLPEPFIPHAGARCRQRNDLHVEQGGALLFFEWLAPGRVASGEVFQYADLCWETDIWQTGQLISRERYRLCPTDDSLEGMKTAFPVAHYLSCFVVGAAEDPFPLMAEIEAEDVYIGCSRLSAGGWTIKLLCRDALAARRSLRMLRGGLHRCLGSTPAALGRF